MKRDILPLLETLFLCARTKDRTTKVVRYLIPVSHTKNQTFGGLTKIKTRHIIYFTGYLRLNLDSIYV